jgi:hypothetical protein
MRRPVAERPAFISAADRASSNGSTGKTFFSREKAASCRRDGKTPVGRRVARVVIAAVVGPCLRVSHGSVPVSAKARSARFPASRMIFVITNEPKVPGARNTTWPSARCGAMRFALSA